jgi:hypothetical protein
VQFLDDATVDMGDIIAREGEEKPDTDMVEGRTAEVEEEAQMEEEERAHWPSEEERDSLDWVSFREEDLWKQIPLKYLSSEGLLVIKDFIARAKRHVNRHEHRPTCAKGRNHSATDEGCRMGYVRLLVGTSYVLSNGVSFVLKRSHGDQVGTIAALLLACPGNHTMQLTSECSRHIRELHLWEEHKKKHPETKVSGWMEHCIGFKAFLPLSCLTTTLKLLSSHILLSAGKETRTSRPHRLCSSAERILYKIRDQGGCSKDQRETVFYGIFPPAGQSDSSSGG